VAGLLFDLATPADGVLLARLLVGERFLGALVRGDVLHLGPVRRLERRLVDGAVVADLVVRDDREVRVDAQRSVARRVEDAEILEYLLQLGEEGAHLAGAAELRRGDDLHQRRPRTVVVDERVVGRVDGAALVLEAPRVLL